MVSRVCIGRRYYSGQKNRTQRTTDDTDNTDKIQKVLIALESVRQGWNVPSQRVILYFYPCYPCNPWLRIFRAEVIIDYEPP